VPKAAELLGIAASTVHRWINDGFIAAEQITPGAPWQIRITDDLRARFVEEAPAGYVPMVDAMRILGVSRQTVLQRVKARRAPRRPGQDPKPHLCCLRRNRGRQVPGDWSRQCTDPAKW